MKHPSRKEKFHLQVWYSTTSFCSVTGSSFFFLKHKHTKAPDSSVQIPNRSKKTIFKLCSQQESRLRWAHELDCTLRRWISSHLISLASLSCCHDCSFHVNWKMDGLVSHWRLVGVGQNKITYNSPEIVRQEHNVSLTQWNKCNSPAVRSSYQVTGNTGLRVDLCLF